MSNETDHVKPIEQGLAALVMLLRFHGVAADPEQIRHQLGATPIGIPEMLRCAKQFGLKARMYTTRWERLATTPLPGIAALRDGGFLLLGKADDDKIIVQYPLSVRPIMMTRAEFEAAWDG
jgi:subfamily B ATP-binding cassette protein HlyB/CyaB